MPGLVTLAQIARHHRMLDVACRFCPRRGRLSVARLIALHGDGAVPDLGERIAADCPRVIAQIASPATTWSTRCGVHFPGLTGRESAV